MSKELFGPTEPGTCIAGVWADCPGERLASVSPATGETLATISQTDRRTWEDLAMASREAFLGWRGAGVTQRTRLVRDIGQAIREKAHDIARLVSIETGMVIGEALKEVTLAAHCAEWAAGLAENFFPDDSPDRDEASTPDARPEEALKAGIAEMWHPLGVAGVITHFSRPMSGWAKHAFAAVACGDVVIWKPSTRATLCALAVQKVVNPVLAAHGRPGIMNLAVGGGSTVGNWLVNDPRVTLVTAVGSPRMARHAGAAVQARLGRCLTETWGSDGAVVAADADLDRALRWVCSRALPLSGQRFDSLRRLIVHSAVHERFVEMLIRAYTAVTVGNSLDPATMMGPLVDRRGTARFERTVARAGEEGGLILAGGRVVPTEKAFACEDLAGGCLVEPAIIKASSGVTVWREPVMAPIVFVFEYEDFDDAMRMLNDGGPGLSSALFTRDQTSVRTFLTCVGPESATVLVNPEAEGEEDGIGNERNWGADFLKNFMRRQIGMVNFD